MKRFKERKIVQITQTLLDYAPEVYFTVGLGGFLGIFFLIKILKYI